MQTHPNARLTPIGRERLIRQHLDEGRNLAQLAADHSTIGYLSPINYEQVSINTRTLTPVEP